MSSEKIIKLKRQIARVSYEEILELKKYVEKKFKEKSKQRYQEDKLKEYNRLRNLELGTRIIIKETRDSLAGRTGKIYRHLGGKSQRTIVEFDGDADGTRWRIPTRWLSDDLSELHINRIKQKIGLNRVFSKVLSKI